MSPKHGWFESDEDYRSRVAREADEHTIKDSTGSAPSQGWFENDDGYRERIAREANERTIKDSTGSAPSQGWFENDDGYRERIAREANERTIKDSTGSVPSQGWFESAENYDTRIRKEANEHIVTGGTGSSPKQSLFEGYHEYRSRIAHEAREVRARERSNSSSGSNSGSSTSPFQGSSSSVPLISGVVGSIVVLGIVVLLIMSYIHNRNLALKEKNEEIDHLMLLAEQSFHKRQLHESEKLISSAFYKAKEFNVEKANLILKKRNTLYTIIDVPSNGLSNQYRVNGSISILFGSPLSKEGGYYFTANDSGTFVHSEKFLKLMTSYGKEYDFDSIKSVSDIAPYGKKHGPFKSQEDSAMQIYFRSTNGKSHRIFVVH